MKYILVFLILISASGFLAQAADFLPVPAKDLVRHRYYTLSYNEQFEQANWVCYVLTDSMVVNGGEERSNKFKIDKLVATGSAKSSDYTKSGYDRGHLCPAADMGFNPVAMEESFMMSNISPQTPDFNRGIWKTLETSVRNWAKQERQIIVVTGPIFKDNKGSIGQDEVAVPGYFFKIIFDDTDSPKMLAFIFPNAKSDRPLTDFAVPTDKAEKLTGYDFFSQLPDELETRLESRVDFSGWFKGYTSSEPIVQQNQMPSETKHSDVNFYLILVLAIIIVILFVFIKGRKRR